jgi:hypothetical protein
MTNIMENTFIVQHIVLCCAVGTESRMLLNRQFANIDSSE